MVDIHELVRELIGPISPVGDAHHDHNCMGNLKRMSEVIDKLLTDMDDIVMSNKDSHLHSCAKAAKFCSDFYDKLGISE